MHSEAIRGNERRRKGNQKQSEALRGNQRQSEAIRGNQRPRKGNQRQAEASPRGKHSGDQTQSKVLPYNPLSLLLRKCCFVLSLMMKRLLAFATAVCASTESTACMSSSRKVFCRGWYSTPPTLAMTTSKSAATDSQNSLQYLTTEGGTQTSSELIRRRQTIIDDTQHTAIGIRSRWLLSHSRP